MKLLHSYILIDKVTEETSKGGIILAVETRNKQLKGRVVALGTDVDSRDMKVNDMVVFDSLNSSQIEIEGRDFTICEYDDIIAVL